MLSTGKSRRYDVAVIFRGWVVGGAERHTTELLNYLSATGLRIVYLQSGFDLRTLGLREIPGKLDIVDIDLGVRRLARRDLRAWSRLLRDNAADRILLIKPGYLSADLPFVRLLRKAAPVVFHFEHSLPQPIEPGPSRLHYGFLPGLGLYWRLEPWRRRLMGRQVDRVFIDSETGRRALIKHTYLPEDRVTACLNGLDVDRWTLDESKGQAFRDRHGIPRESHLFGSCGRLDPLKGLDLALRSFATLKQQGLENVALCIVGEGPSRPELEQLARELGVADRVFFTGYVDDISAAYSAIDTLLFPSQWESCPLVVLEAMACGCRVIAAPVGGVPEIFRDPANGDLVLTRDPGDWAKLMHLHVETPLERRQLLAHQVRAFVIEHHDQRRQFEFLATWFGANPASNSEGERRASLRASSLQQG